MAPKPYLERPETATTSTLALRPGRQVPGALDSSGALSEGRLAIRRRDTGALARPSWPSRLLAPNSYQRIGPGLWSSAYASYGLDNWEAAVRIASPVAGREAATANAELKPVDVTANPHLALAAVLATGMDGMARALDPGEPTMVGPATLSEEERTPGASGRCRPRWTKPWTRWRKTRSS